MRKKEVILDLASSSTWKRKVSKIINQMFPKAVQREIRARDPERIFSDTFKYVIEAYSTVGEEVGFTELNYRLERLFEHEFSHWRGYHACRPRSLNSYKTAGIVPLNREFVISEALESFRGQASEEEFGRLSPKKILKPVRVIFACSPILSRLLIRAKIITSVPVVKLCR